MLDAVYYNPTKIYFGRGVENNIHSYINEYSDSILLVYGKGSIKRSGLYDKLTTTLENNGITYIPLGGVESNPKDDLVLTGMELCKTFNPGFILAVGGGSVIDTAKAIGIGAVHTGSILKFFMGAIPTRSLPVGSIVTIAGAGSESSRSAMISWKNPPRKLSCDGDCLFPKFAVMNPQLTTTVPLFETACGIVDAIMHVLERHITRTSGSFISSYLCESILKTLYYTGPQLKHGLTDYDLRAEVMWACKMAHDSTPGFGRKQDWASHRIAHVLGAHYDLPHGILVGIIGATWLDFVGVPFEAQRLRTFMKRMDLPQNLEQLGIEAAAVHKFERIALECVSPMPSYTIGNYQRLDIPDIVEILNRAYYVNM